MALSAGTRIGPYEILSAIGAGGMGEVYRATDTKLKREVAIKVLPSALVSDSDRLARFQREAVVLAALNHPHIAAIYGLEESESRSPGVQESTPIRALVMELVEGEDLSQIMARGPIALADAIPMARQIADALETAHDQGIVHRDLKPANIKVRPDGAVKVLDFGLAKAMDPTAGTSAEAMNAPTLTSPAMTQMGLILGTAAYMAPEQARGKPVDRRADIWAFGVVLYEMLAGRRAFDGEDISVTLANVIKDDVDWPALPVDVPAPIRQLLRRCLEKDPRRRLRDIGEARVMLEDPASAVPAAGEPTTTAGAVPVPPLWRRALPVAATAVIAGAIAWGLFSSLQPAAPTPIVTRFPLVLPDDQGLSRINSLTVAVSPDGARIVYVANRQLYLRDMADTEARPIPGSNVDPAGVFFSPDGQRVGFASVRDEALQTIAIAGGSPVTLCRVESVPYGASWAGNTIVFSVPGLGIMRVSENGGDPEMLVKSGGGTERLYGPQMLGEDRLMFSVATEFEQDKWDRGEIVVQSLATGERKVVVRGGSDARFVQTSATEPTKGHLLYSVGNTVRAVPIDVDRLEASGTAVVVVEPVARAVNPGVQSGVTQYDVSAAGVLAFVPGALSEAGEQLTLALAGLDGRVQPIALPPAPYIHPRVSPNGRYLAVVIDDRKTANVWVYDLVAGGVARRLTFGGRNLFPIWTRDGRYVTYQSDRDGDAAVFRQLADGSGVAERLTKPEPGVRHEPESWSAGDKALTINVLESNQGVWLVSVDPQAAPQPLVDTELVEKHSAFSPDGHWIAYMANEGSTTVFVQPFPPTGAKQQASPLAETRTPAWSADGKRLFFHSTAKNQLFMVDVQTTPSLTFGTPVPLPIEGTVHPIQQRNYDVMPDGKRLLVVLPATEAKTGAAPDAAEQINVVLNWFEELRARVPVK